MNGAPRLPRKGAGRQLSKISGFILFVTLVLLFGYALAPPAAGTSISYGELIQLLNDPQTSFRDVQVGSSRISGTLTRANGRTVQFTS
jgi:hypothetical protein